MIRENSVLRSAYKRQQRGKRGIVAALVMLTAVCALVSMAAGSAKLSVGQVIQTLAGQGSSQSSAIVLSVRLPRVAAALVSGGVLAVVGCAMQSLLRNPLASSSTLGVSQGAAFGASFAILVLGAGAGAASGGQAFIQSPFLISVCAFLSAMLSTVVVLLLSRFRRLTPEGIVLSGVALSALFSGGTTLLQYFADDTQVASVVFWTFGDLGRVGWEEIAIMAALGLVAIVFFMLNRWSFNALQTGEKSARSLGVAVGRLQIVGLILCALSAATVVSFVGVINFIGLIAPHLLRRVVGDDYRFLLPASALGGALLMLLSDLLARLLIAPVVLPIGAITSFLGAPVFLLLLFRRGRAR